MESLKKHFLLVIAPHPDDEVLGCGGLISKIKAAGGKAYVLFLTVGNTVDFSQKGESSMTERMREIETVAKYLRFDDYHIAFKGDRHLKLDVVGQKEVMQLVERESSVAIEKVKPTVVAFPSQYSYNQDHQLASRAVHAALRPAETLRKHFVPQVLAYEVPADSWSMHHQTLPNFFVPLTPRELDAKVKALKLYGSQMRPRPNLRAVEAVRGLARLRGSLCATHYAESFICYRHVV